MDDFQHTAIDVRVANGKARALGWSPQRPPLLDEIARYPEAMGG